LEKWFRVFWADLKAVFKSQPEPVGLERAWVAPRGGMWEVAEKAYQAEEAAKRAAEAAALDEAAAALEAGQAATYGRLTGKLQVWADRLGFRIVSTGSPRFYSNYADSTCYVRFRAVRGDIDESFEATLTPYRDGGEYGSTPERLEVQMSTGGVVEKLSDIARYKHR
jgi:hypothetical protein